MDHLHTMDSYAKSNSDSSCNSDGSDCGYTDSVSMISSVCTEECTRVHEENNINVMSSTLSIFNSSSFNESALRENPGGVHQGTDERDKSVSDMKISELGTDKETGKI